MIVQIKNYSKEPVQLVHRATRETAFISPGEKTDIDEDFMFGADPRVKIVKRYDEPKAKPTVQPAPLTRKAAVSGNNSNTAQPPKNG